ncbi:Lnb N-terminal periplasmic domain-containing protein [Vibrio marisflavi]|uniref:DUF4105 domain-containing protein n=1 Tax=Vibrio marisflavi CECT 7928 TaxID=634439 RepID=A0ABM9A5C4_9VIBR|nr:DUF4105 domain-containing protein [Vibrio marisflavi]CAH0540153.1 hypothetical protein VMF7928_02648 [Vibrio marisflavi CECT 7928]
MKFKKVSVTLLLCQLLVPFAYSSTSTPVSIERLYDDPYWLKLGHYQNKLLSGHESNVVSKQFFLAEQGKVNPNAELAATISALYNQDEQMASEMKCRYPARYTWLEQKQGRVAELNCPELERWRQVIDPMGMTLVFPTAYMNNPSSMFGHTLLRVDAKDQTRHKELVAFAINFAAEPETDDNAALYALKGLIGSYPGRFTLMPYYRKVREYNDLESRDIWEYKLKLNPQEVNRILLHLWELQHAEFDYYFLDENCSYQLLALIELANDDLSLIDDFPLHAIPSDTVATLEKNNLLAKPKYRPAFGTRLLHQSNEINEQLYSAAALAKEQKYMVDNQLSQSDNAAVLEFAYEWLNFELYEGGRERDPTAKRLTSLLYQRSQLKVESPFTPVPEPGISPEKGHGSARLGLNYTDSKNYSSRVGLESRIAYHDLLDSQSGFIPGAKISFLDTSITANSNGNTRLERFYFIDAMALAPSNRTFDSFAWNIRTGFDRKPAYGKEEGRWFGQGGFGKAWGQSDGLHIYALLSGAASGGELTNYDLTPGAGIETGLLYQLADQHRLGLQGQYLALIDNDADQDAAITASWNWSLNRNWALRSQIKYRHWYTEDTSATLTAYFYY